MSGLELRCVHALPGPNIWARVPVIEVCLRGRLPAVSSTQDVLALKDRVAQCLSAVKDPTGKVGQLNFAAGADSAEGLLAELVGQLTLSLQTLAGTRVSFTRAVPASESGAFRVLIEFEEAELARACADVARDFCLAAADDRPYPLTAEVKRLRDVADRVCLGPSTQAIVSAARARGIPVRRLNTGSLVQLGQGFRQHRICAAETDRTGAIAETIACDKELTKRLLRAVGVPVPAGRLVSDAQDACRAAGELQSPVVVKPLNGNHGRAVFIGLTRSEEIASAFDQALVEGDGVLVERSISGAEHRLLVVGDQLVAATRGDPVFVLGDGQRTVAELVAELNRDPRRGEDAELPLSPVEFDPPNLAVLAHQGYFIETVPPAGEQVLVQRNGNLSNDVTDQVHPENAAAAVLAAKTVGLDVAGVDIVADDISRPLRLQGGAVVEVNAGPGLQMHLQPGTGRPRPAGKLIVASLFPPAATGRIPLVAVTGGSDRTLIARLISHLLHVAGVRTGLACAAGTFANGQPLRGEYAADAHSAADLLLHPLIETAVFETPEVGVIRDGLGFDRCRVVVLAEGGPAETAASPPLPTSPGELAAARQALLATLDSDGAVVLSAEAATASDRATPGAAEVVLFAEQPAQLALRTQRERGGRAVFVRETAVVAAHGDQETVLADLASTSLHAPAVRGSVLASLAAAWALQVPTEALQNALNSFVVDRE